VDLDFVLVEYDHAQVMALVEYKHENAAPQRPSHPSYRALADLGSRATIPVFAVRYAGDFTWWRVTPLNLAAHLYVKEPTTLNERQWVRLLYRIRGRTLPVGLFATAEVPA
jgi:hypothetical protein